MIASLDTWLIQHRETLLQAWLTNSAVVTNGHQVALPTEEWPARMTALYDGLVQAAAGEYQLLDEYLHLARAFRHQLGEDELQEQLKSLSALRRLAFDHLLAELAQDASFAELVRDLDHLFEHTSLRLVESWTASANLIAQQLQQAEMLAASLNEATEHSDRIALQMLNLNEIGRNLTSSLDIDHLLEVVCERLAQTLGVNYVAILLSDDHGLLQVRQQRGYTSLDLYTTVIYGTHDLVQQGFQLGQVVAEYAPVVAEQGSWYQEGQLVLVVPLVAQGVTTGVIVLQDAPDSTLLAQEQQRFVHSVASQAAISLENAQLYAKVREFNTELELRIAARTVELQTERDTLSTLYDLALEVSSSLDVDTLLQACLELLARLVNVEHGSIMLIERETEQLVTQASLGLEQHESTQRFPMGHGVAGWVAQRKTPALIDDVALDERWMPPPDELEPAKRSGSMLAVPLVAHYDVLGVMVLSHSQAGHFHQSHLRLLSTAAGQIALGIYNALLYEQIQQELLRQGERLRNERRSAAQSYAILQSLSDGVIVCNAEGSVLATNPAASHILERDMEELLTWQLPDLLHRLLGQHSPSVPLEQMLAHPHDAAGRPRHFNTTFKMNTRVVSVSLDPVVLSNDEVLGAVAVFRDITREVESERLKDEFIGTVSHELRTPMTSIKGYTQLMAMGSLGPVSDTQRDFLKTINVNAERMITIIDDLLDLTKIETGSVLNELDLRPVHVAEALSNVIVDLQPKMTARELDLSVNVPLDLPFVRVDARRFGQILSNLLSNAVKYTLRQGKIFMEASVVRDSDLPEKVRDQLRSGRYVRVDIRDTGVGIDPAEHEKVFERFYRTENPLKIEAGGTGLGLSLVRPLVRLFGGQIWLTSAVGEGTTVSFVVPVIE